MNFGHTECSVKLVPGQNGTAENFVQLYFGTLDCDNNFTNF